MRGGFFTLVGFWTLVMGFGALRCFAGLLGSGMVQSKTILLEYRSGTTELVWRAARRQREYPRVHGDNRPFARSLHGTCGISPRARGQPSPSDRLSPCLWNIPACAGSLKDHPRTCGAICSSFSVSPDFLALVDAPTSALLIILPDCRPQRLS